MHTLVYYAQQNQYKRGYNSGAAEGSLINRKYI